jgi:hypothetical protein
MTISNFGKMVNADVPVDQDLSLTKKQENVHAPEDIISLIKDASPAEKQ